MARPMMRASLFGATPQNQRPHFENRDGNEEHPFDGEEGVEFAEDQLKGGCCEQICCMNGQQ